MNRPIFSYVYRCKFILGAHGPVVSFSVRNPGISLAISPPNRIIQQISLFLVLEKKGQIDGQRRKVSIKQEFMRCRECAVLQVNGR